MAKSIMSKAERREERLGFLFISPWLIGLVIFAVFPIAASLIISFMKWDIYQSPSWVGLDNFKHLFHDKLFYKSLRVTLVYSAFAIPLGLIFGLALSLMLNLNIRGINTYRTLFYLPSVISGVAIAMVWKWIFNSDYGLLNYLLSLIGIHGPKWLEDPNWILTTYIIMSLWSIGGSAIIFLGGLQNIPGHLYEAAKIDGARLLQRFSRITLPLLTPTLFFQLLMGIIGSFQVFTSAFIMNGRGGSSSGGGPNNEGLFYMLYLYQKAFKTFDMGYASAMAWVGGIISFILAIVVYKSQGKWVFYDAEDNNGKGKTA
ncbi:carbohydrate ABC transporter permease [Paenibacillus lycopersici]|nr:sugar ABC transporter permease [Paenibacillus lycopersici]